MKLHVVGQEKAGGMSFEAQENLLNWLRTQDRILQYWRDEMLSSPDTDVRFIERLEAHRSWLAWELQRVEAVA